MAYKAKKDKSGKLTWEEQKQANKPVNNVNQVSELNRQITEKDLVINELQRRLAQYEPADSMPGMGGKEEPIDDGKRE